MTKRSRRTGKFYSQNEKKVMESLGLTPTKMSGAGWVEKSDGYNDNVIAELKSTDANSYRLKRDEFRKLEYHALVAKKIPLFVVEFLKDGELYLVIKPEDLTSIVNYITLPENLLEANFEPLGGIEIEAEDIEPEIVKKKAVKSGNKSKYWDKVQKEREANKCKK